MLICRLIFIFFAFLTTKTFFFSQKCFFFFRAIFFGRFYPPQKVFILISDKYHGALNLISDKWHELLHKNKDNDPTLKNTILLQIHRNFLDLIFYKIHLAKQQIHVFLVGQRENTLCLNRRRAFLYFWKNLLLGTLWNQLPV